MQTIDSSHLWATYDAVLLDAYGVLVDASGVLPHARAFIEALVAHDKPFYIVTNDASRLPEAIAAAEQLLQKFPDTAMGRRVPGLLAALRKAATP